MTTATAAARVEPLIAQLDWVKYALEANTEGLAHDESLLQPPAGGNCLNWVMGHIVATRNNFLTLLGKEPIWDDQTAARYRRYSEPITGPGDGVLPFETILAAYRTSHEAIVAGLTEISDQELDVPVPWFGKDQPKLVALAGLVFHETYHAGQTGVLRRAAGREGAIK